MNISSQNLSGACDYKCSYAVNYNNSASSITNMGSYIRLTYENTTASQMLFNSQSYTIDSISLYSPSLHLYNGVAADAEICITHIPNSVANLTLQVCIPVSTTAVASKASDIVTNWVNAAANGAPAKGESTSQGLTNFNLNDIVPVSSYYSYTGVNNLVGQSQDFVAYGIENAISISSITWSTLRQVIESASPDIFPGGAQLFQNQKGTSTSVEGSSGEIYIDCQPTNASDENVDVGVGAKIKTEYDLFSFLSSPYFIYIIFACFVAAFIMAIRAGLQLVSK